MGTTAVTRIATRRDENALREQIVAFGKSLFDRGLAAGSSGNLSVRLDDGWLVTPTNASLGSLDPARLSKLDWHGNVLSGDAPSKESVLHRAMYEERLTAGAIVHLHATYSAAVSCMSGLDASDCLPPLTAYFVMKIGTLPLVPYFRPGDPAIAGAIRGLAARHTALLLSNHGPVVSGRSLEAAVYAIEELEETAKLFLLLRGSPVRPLDEVQIAEIRKAFASDA
ncbi:MAG TPA: 3-oxo-tetronate 4-phosphate decarboxylase [Casimicrobiaceae bacterium]|jgi:ribulose-5-phosphate 4-epimerase/fuculose-1-phosphate aldolase|nr:3-oxo-tetronate 4-phosphate decarboxylase [Casimicrobiaceae bacterium]